MKMSNLLSIALKNLRRHRKHHIQVFFGVFLSVFCIMTVVLYSMFLNKHINTTIPDNLNCYLTYHSDDTSNNYKEECESATVIKGVGAVLGLTDLSLYSMNMNSNNDMPYDFTFDNEILNISGKQYSYSHSDMLQDEYGIFSGIELFRINPDIFDLNDYLNLYYNEAFLYGSTGINDGDVIIPEQYLILYGIPESEYESFIGKSLSIELKFPKNYTATPEYRICGIIKQECYNSFPVSLIVSSDMTDSSTYSLTYVYFENFENDLFNSAKKELDQIFNNKGNICSDYENIITLHKQISFANHVLLIIVLILSMSFLLHLIIYLFFYINRNEMYMALLLSLGMNSKNITMLNVIEITMNSLFSSICGVLCSYLLSFNIDKYINSDKMVIMWDAKLLLIALLITVPVVIILMALISGCYVYRQCRYMSPEQLFNK